MTDAEPTAERLSELEGRWRDKPQSRVFLQLAEEYRRQGQQARALEVLSEGLERHPGHVSALVALGRCQLELGRADAAVETLEGVVTEDATHLVAAKLLVEAHIQRDDPVRARRRLDLYQQLNPADGEIAQLRKRIESLQLADPEPLGSAADDHPAARSPAQAEATGWGGVTEASGEAVAEAASAEQPAAEAAAQEEPAEQAAPATTPVRARRLLVPGDGDPFPVAAADWSGYLQGLSAEGIFPPVEEPPPVAEEGTPEPAAGAAAAAGEDDETLTLWRRQEPREAAPAAEEDDTELVAPLPLPAVAPATVTLADLYLRQGHRREAERIYRRVLEKQPGNEAAESGLQRLGVEVPVAAPAATAAESTPARAEAPYTLTARELLADDSEAAQLPPVERKVRLLERYLRRLRRGAASDVP